MKQVILILLLIGPLISMAQRSGTMYFNKSLEISEERESNSTEVTDNDSEAENEKADIGSILEGITPLTGGFIVPALDLEFGKRIGINKHNYFSFQLFAGNDLEIDGDTLGTPEVREALSKGFLIPEASNFRFNLSWVYACNGIRMNSSSKDDSETDSSQGDDTSDASQTPVEKAFFLGASLDIVSKRVPVANSVDSRTTWDKQNFEMIYLTLTSQYRLQEGSNYQIGLYSDLRFAAIASEREEIEAYYSTLDQTVSAPQLTIIPKLGVEVFYEGIAFDLGYIFKTKSGEQYFQSNDPGFFVIKLSMNTKFRGI